MPHLGQLGPVCQVDLVGLPRRLYQVGHQGLVRQVDLVGRVVLALSLIHI